MSARIADTPRQPAGEDLSKTQPDRGQMLKSSSWSPRLFLFHYERAIDRAGRAVFPRKWRARDGGDIRVNVALSDVGCIVGAPREFCLNGIVPGAIVGSKVQELTIGPSGEFVLDPALRSQAGIEGRLLFTGLYDRFELWNPTRHTTFMDSQPPLSDLLKRFGI